VPPLLTRYVGGRLRLAAAAILLTTTACGAATTVRTIHPPRVAIPTTTPTTWPLFDSIPTPSLIPTATPNHAPPSFAPATARPTAKSKPVGTFQPVVGPTLGGCQVFPVSNPWNQDVSRAPLDPNSANYIASINSSRHFLHADFGSDPSYGIPYVVVPASQPFVPIAFTAYGDQSDPGPYPIPSNAPVEAGSDAHVVVADSGNCHLYELFNASRQGNGWAADSGAVFNLNSNALRPDGWTSADAAGLPILPGLARYDEVRNGVINHALRFTVQQTQDGFIHPATHQAGVNNTNAPPMGLRLRLKASFDLSPFHGESLVILTALKRYGMFVADNGSSWFITGATDSRWNDTDLNQLKTVPGSAFEAVQTGPILHSR